MFLHRTERKLKKRTSRAFKENKNRYYAKEHQGSGLNKLRKRTLNDTDRKIKLLSNEKKLSIEILDDLQYDWLGLKIIAEGFFCQRFER